MSRLSDLHTYTQDSTVKAEDQVFYLCDGQDIKFYYIKIISTRLNHWTTQVQTADE